MRFLAKKCENIAKSRQKMIPAGTLICRTDQCHNYETLYSEALTAEETVEARSRSAVQSLADRMKDFC